MYNEDKSEYVIRTIDDKMVSLDIDAGNFITFNNVGNAVFDFVYISTCGRSYDEIKQSILDKIFVNDKEIHHLDRDILYSLNGLVISKILIEA